MKKILTIVGARPQFIKAAAISHTISRLYTDLISEDILHTGQHYDAAMSDQFFTELAIPTPRYNLGVGSGSHAQQTARMLTGIEEVLLAHHYDGMIVYGDTNSTLAGALAAAKLHLPIYHIEAGLRSFNRAMPEEINRIATDHISNLLFAPTHTAVANLKNEGFSNQQVIFSGDVMLDNVRYYSPLLHPSTSSRKGIFATLHRDFNTDSPQRLTSILSAMNAIGKELNTEVFFAVHPRTQKAINALPHRPPMDHLHCTQPLSYLQTLSHLIQSQLVLTDSGGLQKEAYFCGCPCVILRHETEWTEIVDAHAAITADANPSRILDAAHSLLAHPIKTPDEFGNGNASEIILQQIINQ